MDKVLEYIELLESNSFEHWTDEEKLGYLTACISIRKFIEKRNLTNESS